MKKTSIDIQNTRLFPKHHGAAAYELTGIAARCDWAIMSDGKEGCTDADFFIHGDLSLPPRTVFLSMRGFFSSIPYFYHEILPQINSRFVLITGSEDLTIPNQTDKRWRAFNQEEQEIVYRILEDERLIHWFAENRDAVLPKMSTLPIGYLFKGAQKNPVVLDPQPGVPVTERPLRALCCHWIRPSPQWDKRSQVTKLCKERFGDLVTMVEQGVSEHDYINLVEENAFVLCVQGGGIDPSPKAWTAIAHGAIPIIESSPLDDAYSQLPVAFVERWDENSLSERVMREWIDRLSPFYTDPEKRMQVLERLKLDYWWGKIVTKWANGFNP